MKIAFTGHRPPRLKGKEQEIGKWIYKVLSELKEQDSIELAYNGVAKGADQLAAIKALELNIPLCCCYPYPRKYFSTQEEYLNESAAKIDYISDKYSKDCFFKRDKYMVDNCDILIAIWDGNPPGGTYYTVKYAKEQGKRIIYMPKDIL